MCVGGIWEQGNGIWAKPLKNGRIKKEVLRKHQFGVFFFFPLQALILADFFFFLLNPALKPREGAREFLAPGWNFLPDSRRDFPARDSGGNREVLGGIAWEEGPVWVGKGGFGRGRAGMEPPGRRIPDPAPGNPEGTKGRRRFEAKSAVSRAKNRSSEAKPAGSRRESAGLRRNAAV